ncbi:MAG: RNA polymerase sigma factor [Actinomycetota bacterium]|nr:RNA polymerase sigma factor [Actinomycetota bacterium]
MDSEENLITRTLQGDLTAFEELVERHRDVVFRVAARIVGYEDAADVSQDSFLRAFHRLERFQGAAPFRSWLLQIAHNAALDSRARKQRHSTELLPEEDAYPDRDPHRQPVSQLERRERQQRLELKLHLLRDDYRTLLVLRDLEELPYEDIAQVLEMPLGTVKGRLHRARAELIELLRNNTYDWELPA